MYKKILVLAVIIPALFMQVAAAEDAETLKKELASALASNLKTRANDVINLLRDLNSGPAAEAIIQNMGKMVYESAILETAQKALAGMSNDDARKAVASNAVKHSDFQVRTILAEILGQIGDKEAIAACIKLLGDSKEVVQKTAARALGDMGGIDSVKPLLDAMKKYDKTKGGPYYDINKALRKLTGKDLDEYADWVSWYADGAGLKNATPGQAETPGATVDAGGPRFGTSIFGIPIDSRRICVLLDISGSMNITDPPPEGGDEAAVDAGKDMSTGVKDEKKAKEDEERKKKEEAAKAEAERKGLSAERMRIKRAKNELMRMIKAFDPAVKFNIIVFSEGVTAWKDKIQPANEANKQTALQFVDKLAADGSTHTDDSFKEAFKDKDVDTIVLISDGAPMHEPFAGGTQLPDESYRLMDEILAWITENNRFRKLSIHTIGFPGAEKDWMGKIAKENNGTFKEIK
jgi:hypothetical protein